MAAAHKPDPSTSHDGPSKLSRAVTTGTSADEADLASHVPSKMLTPHAEHLRFGHVDYEAIEQDADEEKRHYLIRRPRAHQWFFKGKLYRSPEGRSSSRMELFFDLIYVAIIATIAEAAVEQPNGSGLVKYILTYLPAFLIWDSTRELVNILWTDDVAQRTILVWIMMLLVAYANNANFVGDAHHTEDAVSEIASSAARRLFIRAESSEEFPGGGRTTAIVLYIVATWTLHLCRFAASFYVFQYKRQFLLHTVWSFVPLAFYIGAIFASERAAIALVAVGLALEYLGWQAIYSPHLKKVFRLTYSSALNIEHEVDRHADFFTIVVGEFIYSAISGAPAGLGIDRATGRACLILLIAASLQLLYMRSSGSLSYVHPLRHSGNTATAWFMLHIPAVAALTLAGDAGHQLIANEYGVRQGVRWYFCAGIAIGLLCTWGLAMMEVDKDEGKLAMRKELRLLPRFAVGTIVVFLPLKNESALPSTSLVAVSAALCYFTLLWETIFSLHKPDKAFPYRGWFGMPRLVDPRLSETLDEPRSVDGL